MSLLSLLRRHRRPRLHLAPAHRIALRQGDDRLIADLKNAVPVVETGTAPMKAVPMEGPTAMTIVRRQARNVHAGDVIVTDPDHPDRVVRWRAQQPAKRVASGLALIPYIDLADGGEGLAVFEGLAEVSVEPVGVR